MEKRETASQPANQPSNYKSIVCWVMHRTVHLFTQLWYGFYSRFDVVAVVGVVVAWILVEKKHSNVGQPTKEKGTFCIQCVYSGIVVFTLAQCATQ